jgi:hypothetical protein
MGRMSALSGFRLCKVAAIAVLCIWATAVFAGEPIIVGKERPKASEPIQDSKFTKELFRPWDKSAPTSPLDGLVLPNIPRIDIDPKKDRKRKLQELEKKNWISVKPGELQEEEEAKNFLGVREYDLDKEKDTENLMFRDLQKDKDKTAGQTKDKTQSRSNQPSKDNQAAAQQQQRDADELQRELEARRAARDAATKSPNGVEYGAHTATELNFKNVFGTAPGSSSRSSDISLRDVLGGQQSTPSQQALREEFKTFLNGSPNTRGNGTDPINSWRNDATRQPLNPAIANEPKNDVFNPSVFSQTRPASPFATPSTFDSGLKTPNTVPGLGLGGPSQPQRWTPPPTAAEIQRSMGLGTFGGHR